MIRKTGKSYYTSLKNRYTWNVSFKVSGPRQRNTQLSGKFDYKTRVGTYSFQNIQETLSHTNVSRYIYVGIIHQKHLFLWEVEMLDKLLDEKAETLK